VHRVSASQQPLDARRGDRLVDDLSRFESRIRRSFAWSSRIRFEFRQFAMPADILFPTPYQLTVETYLRFWIRELAPGRSRAIYLDADTIVTGPIEELWNTDLRGNVLGAVPIPNSVRVQQHGLPPGSLFFNAGVLLIDLQKWGAGGYRDRCLEYLRAHPEHALDGDQDILNLCLAGEWLPLPYEWNVINPFFRPSYDLGIPAPEVARICQNARIVHFNGRHKPWIFLDNHPRQRQYMELLAETDWRNWRPSDWTPMNRLRKPLQAVLPSWATRGIKAVARSWPPFRPLLGSEGGRVASM